MARKAEELYREAAALSEEERERLVRLLTMHRDSGFASRVIEQAWIEECDRRYQEWRDGKVEATPAEVVHRGGARTPDEMKARYLPAAISELADAARFYEEARPGLGDAFMSEVERAI